MEEFEDDLSQWFTKDGQSNFKIEYIKNKNYLKSFKLIYSNCKDIVCSITYDVSYIVKSEAGESVMDVRKQAILRNSEDSRWLIDELDIIKSYINNKKPIRI